MKKIVVMASGEGSNFSAIIDNKIKIDRVITDNKNANVIKRAEKANVPIFVFDYKEGEYKNGFGWCERKIDETIPEDVDLIVLAGYMRILSPRFVKKWKDKIINIHPSLLPAFKGSTNAIEEAHNYGCKVFGVTVHWVTEEVDAGAIIDQRAMQLGDTPLEEVKEMIHTYIEHIMYPQTIKELISR